MPGSRQIATSEDEGGLVAVRPPQPFGFKTERGLIRSRPHDIAVNRLKEGLDESWVQGAPPCKFVCVSEPADATVLSSDKAVEACRHVNRYARISVCHHVAPRWRTT